MEQKPRDDAAYIRIIHEQQERLKELSCINRATQILKERKPVEETLMHLVLTLPSAWQYPDYTVARIRYRDKSFETPGFKETAWKMVQGFTTVEGEGSVEICYTREFMEEYEGPFMKEERDLIR
jgi:hypothetical protein